MGNGASRVDGPTVTWAAVMTTAALVLGLLHGDALDAMHAFASEVAGYVCTCAGATPLLPERFTQRFRRAADGTW